MAADWQSALTGRFTAAELERIIDFLRTTIEVGQLHVEALHEME